MRDQTRERPQPEQTAGAGGEHIRRGARDHYTAAPSDVLLPRLAATKSTGPGRWVAPCPSHADRHPSLSIRETGDGTLLVRCWAGCGAGDVMAAVGLELRDLFPARREGRGPLRRGERWVPSDVLRCLAREALVALMAAESISRDLELTADDRHRLAVAVGRLRAAAREVGHG